MTQSDDEQELLVCHRSPFIEETEAHQTGVLAVSKLEWIQNLDSEFSQGTFHCLCATFHHLLCFFAAHFKGLF